MNKSIVMLYSFLATMSEDNDDTMEKILEKWIENPEKYYCLCCGVEISEEQFCYSHGFCEYCDSGACQTAQFVFKKGHGKFLKLFLIREND